MSSPSPRVPPPEPPRRNGIPTPPGSRPRRIRPLWLAGGWLLLWFAALTFFQPSYLVDEAGHQLAIERLSQGEWSSASYLVMLPGYHALLAVPSALLGPSLGLSRFLTFLMSLATLFLLASAGRRRDGHEGEARVLMLAILPIYFPYTCLIYTDAAAVLFIVGALWAQIHRRYRLSAILLLAACLVRQSSVVWGGFLVAWNILEARRESYLGDGFEAARGSAPLQDEPAGGLADDRLDESGPQPDEMDRDIPAHAGPSDSRGSHTSWVARLLPRIGWQLAVVAVVSLALAGTGGLLSQEVPENRPQPNIGNLYLIALLALLLWAPVWIGRARSDATRLGSAMRARPGLAAAWTTLLALVAVLLAWTYDNWHIWNQDPAFLRNLPLVLMQEHVPLRLLGAGIIILAAWLVTGFWQHQPSRAVLLLVGLFSLLFLIPHSLVEARYAIVPFLLADFFTGYGPTLRRQLTIWYAALSLLVGGLILSGRIVLW
jgi:hypothetical protein